MKKVIVTVEFTCEVDEHINPNDVVLNIDDKAINVVDFDNRNRRIGFVKTHSAVDIESLLE